MKLSLSVPRLHFRLPENLLSLYTKQLIVATSEVKELTRHAGTHSEKFRLAFRRVASVLVEGKNLSASLNSPIDLRVLATLFNTEMVNRIRLTSGLLGKVTQIRSKPSSLLLGAIFDHYLKEYDRLDDLPAVEAWLIDAKRGRKELTHELSKILGGNGPKWLAEESRRHGIDFAEQVRRIRLDRYVSGRFLSISKSIYYLDVLRQLSPNEEHPILDEMQKRAVYESRYDETSLLGHEILKILIEKAPSSGVGDAWRNVILAIAGDPRVPSSHPNHLKWWSQLDSRLKAKVQGWLSKLDLKLFLEALENFSYASGNTDLKRMYPARKRFMEGLLEKQLVTGTRLFLSHHADWYLKRNYKKEHLPNYSLIDGDRSLIHIQLSSSHMIEGSHNCKLWIYERLDPSSKLFNYSHTQFTYRSLTSGLQEEMIRKGIQHIVDITHNPSNFSWQHKAILALRKVGVQIDSRDVLTPDDYKKYKRMHGV